MKKYFVRHKEDPKRDHRDCGEIIRADYFDIKEKCIIFFLKSGEKVASFPAKIYYVTNTDNN